MHAADSACAAQPAARPPGSPRPAATLVVVRDRDGAAGIEVLLLRRAERGDHNSGAWVFPGGMVEAGDAASHAVCDGPSDAEASARLGVAHGGLDFHVTAIRECFKEAGLLLARPAGATTGAGLPLVANGASGSDEVAVAPAGQLASADGDEVVAHRWLRPADALARAVPLHDAAGDAGPRHADDDGLAGRRDTEDDGDAGRLKLMGPTRATLARLARFDSAAAVLAWASAQPVVPLTAPRIGLDSVDGRAFQRPVLPDEGAWAEIGRLDPLGAGTAHCTIRPGQPVRLSARVIRLTAGNGSVMTGPGTNSYLVRAGDDDRGDWAVIDPGPLDDGHVDRLIAAVPGRILWVFATHTHTDHSPAAVRLRALTGAQLLGRLPAHPDRQDAGFAPDCELRGGERIALSTPGGGAGSTLAVIHTPGHASNHLCYLLEEERTLFTGDHLMQASTVVINPPDGDMAAYLASLRELLAPVQAGAIDWLAPGHGFLMAQPRQAIEAVIAHRLRREAKVVAALRDGGPATAEALLARVYDDVYVRLHRVALRSLEAHLAKLRDHGPGG